MKSRTKPTGMIGDLCLDCLSYRHPSEGRCGHDPEAACKVCGLSQGYPTPESLAAGMCWWCTTNRPRPTGPTLPKPEPELEF